MHIGLVLATALALMPLRPGAAAAQPSGVGFVPMQWWLQAAEATAGETLIHEICGWGIIDLLTPFLRAAERHGVHPMQLPELVARYDAAMLERRRLEAAMAVNPRNLPLNRDTGLLPTDSCSTPTRKRVMDLLETPIGANGAGGYAFSMP
ncbi:MAG TPA: hypothetical protein VGN75_11090 [Kaistia sp.]|jgi:hypothetical protein|nr:hypothetical protein [Kaistia sp.]